MKTYRVPKNVAKPLLGSILGYPNPIGSNLGYPQPHTEPRSLLWRRFDALAVVGVAQLAVVRRIGRWRWQWMDRLVQAVTGRCRR